MAFNIQEAAEKQNFWMVSEEKFIKIIQMPKLWSKHPELKINVKERLIDYDENNDLITSFNFDNTKYDAYQSLVDDYNIWIKDTLKTSIKAPGHKLTSELPESKELEETDINEPVESGSLTPTETIASELDESVPIKFVTKTVKRPKNPVNLQLKIDKLEDNKIINVSNMNEYGVGIKTVVYNKTKHADKYFLKNKTLMSDNYKNLMYALNLLKGGKEKYIKDIRKSEKFFDITEPYIQKSTESLTSEKTKKGKKKISKYDKYKTELSENEESESLTSESEPEKNPKPKSRKKIKVAEESEAQKPKKKSTKKSKVEYEENEPKKTKKIQAKKI